MMNLIIALLILFGALVIFIAGIGILRLPNLLSRMHAVTKVSSFGLLLLLIAINLFALDWGVFIKTIIIFFVLINLSPMASFLLAKVSKEMDDNETNNE